MHRPYKGTDLQETYKQNMIKITETQAFQRQQTEDKPLGRHAGTHKKRQLVQSDKEIQPGETQKLTRCSCRDKKQTIGLMRE